VIGGGIREGETVAGEAGGLPLDAKNSLALRGAEQYFIPLLAQYQQSLVLMVYRSQRFLDKTYVKGSSSRTVSLAN